jgi:TPP-dependent pyruvate/acetoin dehydrogenase alpha subunit
MASRVQKKRGKVPPSAQSLDPSASNPPSNPPSNSLIGDAKLRQLYSAMLQCRILDQRALEIRPPSSRPARNLGREAAVVGAALDLRRDDWLAPLQFDVLAGFLKGVPLASVLSQLHQPQPGNAAIAGSPTASASGEDRSALRIIPSAANPAAQLNLASGVALALKAAKNGNIVMAFCGDTSESGQRWREALAFVGKHCLPLLVIVQTNAPSRAATARKGNAVTSVMSEGHACAVPVIPVDADDVVAIYRVAFESIHKARHGGGPTLIQAISLAAGQASSRKPPDAIGKMEDYLAAKGLFSPEWQKRTIDAFNRDVNSAIGALKKPALRNRK